MKNIIYITLSCLLLFVIYSCNKSQTDFKKFQGDKEIIYTGAVGQVITQPGNLRVGLKWKSSSDPSIVKYVIYWNNKADSQVMNITTKTDSIKTVINGLQEFVYSFVIYSYDAKGNSSIPTEVNNVKAYGPIYVSTLLNRPYNAKIPYVVSPLGDVTLNFKTADTINISTKINYTNRSGQNVTVALSSADSVLTIHDLQSGSQVTYNSTYIPDRNSIDIFTAPKIDVFPTILGYAQCDKSLFKKSALPNDMGPYEGDTDVDQLWNGSTTPQGFPHLFHADGNDVLPRTLTFDMGKVYKSLKQVEEIGRNCCNNPDDFEIWGIADITNAATNLKSNDPGWKAEAVAKGWTLLKEVKRTDDGMAPFKVDLDNNLPPVRYIRVRVLHNVNGETRYTNISQISLFYDVFNQ
ncbi:protein of unknown function [Mucilaginibacter pineti]|uniref:Uncharacterized protein n=1 Tax=Mucilaginibacter pineti TaxID=1391627 RepID=A0A1G7EWF9_9SPHI|nr:DUF4998 domain-containing protein [Mucilaginibacter pineti]SDE67962.1 protein of unknown function [Mucilaginibacter pineti]